MLKRIGVSILIAIAFLTAVAQKSTSYEIEKDYPLFLEKMKQELTYPMAWGIVPRLIFRVAENDPYDCSGCNVGSTACCQRIWYGSCGYRTTGGL